MNLYLFYTLLLSFFYQVLNKLRLELVIRNQLTHFYNSWLLLLFTFLSKLLINVLKIFTFQMDQHFVPWLHFIIFNTINSSSEGFLLKFGLSHLRSQLNNQTRIFYLEFLIWFRSLPDLSKNQKKKRNFYF